MMTTNLNSLQAKTASRYGVAIATSAFAFALALRYQHPLDDLSPFLTFYAAVAISSWFGGTGPGLLATAIGALAADYSILTPLRSFHIEHPEDLGRLMLFASVGVLIALLNGALRRANVRCEREAEAARKSAARAKRLAEANLIGVFFSDLKGNIRWANREFLRLIGQEGADDELARRAMNWRDVTAPEHRARDEKAIGELAAERVCRAYEKDHLLEDGRRIPVLCGCAASGEYGASGEVEDIVGFVLDLTERKRAEIEATENQQRLRAMSAELMMAEERERRRIATILHDSVVQILAAAKMNIEVAQRGCDDCRNVNSSNGGSSDGCNGDGHFAPIDPRPTRQPLNRACNAIDQAIAQTRTLTAEISPPVLYELGLPSAIQWLGQRMQRDHDIAFELDCDAQPQPLDDQTRTVLFQAVRELLVNVAKHAGASRCKVLVRHPDDQSIHICVEDDGVGLSDRPTSLQDYARGGFGLFNIRQRLEHLGGTLEMKSRPEGGTRISIVAPSGLPPAATAADAAVPTASTASTDSTGNTETVEAAAAPRRSSAPLPLRPQQGFTPA